MNRLRERLASQEGFTLIELLVVIVIIGILLAIAIPSYLGFTSKAQNTAASSDVRSAVPDAELWYSDHQTYTGMTAALLKSNYDSGLSPNVVVTVGTGGTTYCLDEPSNAAGVTYYYSGPGGTVTSTDPGAPCP